MLLNTASAAPGLFARPAPGRHFDPADGACLMEAASLLAGEPFSDHPRCVHPTLAALARILNDATSAAGRTALWPLLPDLIAAPARDPRTAPTVVLHVLALATTRHTVGAAGRLARRHATHRLTRLDAGGPAANWVRVTDVLYRHSAERSVTRALCRTIHAHPSDWIDREAPRLLAQCLPANRTPEQRPGP